MAYTPYVPRTKTTPNNFSGLRTDGNRVAMLFGNTVLSQDATGTPVTSPTTVNTATTLICPTGAVQLTVSPVTNPVRVSEDSTSSAYFAVPAGAVYTLDCANMTSVYLSAGSSTVVSFQFKIV